MTIQELIAIWRDQGAVTLASWSGGDANDPDFKAAIRVRNTYLRCANELEQIIPLFGSPERSLSEGQSPLSQNQPPQGTEGMTEDNTKEGSLADYIAELMFEMGVLTSAGNGSGRIIATTRPAVNEIDCTAIANAIAARLTSAKTGEWQPIETAPKDGKFIWLSDGAAMRIGFWSNGKQFECHGTVGGGWRDFVAAEARGACDLAFLPTHWRPLPAPPSGAR